jgi:spore coat protein U-like protein
VQRASRRAVARQGGRAAACALPRGAERRRGAGGSGSGSISGSGSGSASVSISSSGSDTCAADDGRCVASGDAMKRLSPALLFAPLLAISPAAHALLQSCSFTATDVQFGTYSPLSAAPLDITGTVTVSCTVTLVGLLEAWDIRFSTGSSNSFTTRQMTQGATTLSYNLYTDTAHTQIWGDGTAGTFYDADLILLSIGTNNYPYTVYGRVPVGQDKRAGTYSDTITVTLNY